MGLNFGDRHGNATILDFDNDSKNERDDEISDAEFLDHDDQLNDNHTLGSSNSIANKDDVNDYDSGSHDDNSNKRSDNDYHIGDDSVGNNTPPVVDHNDHDGSDNGSNNNDEQQHSSRSRQGPEQYVAGPASGRVSSMLSHISVVFFQAVS